ncbi:SusC/RagA family TonB-linked outer membrane protein [Aestuariibaculum sp. YM273]|uniref:SusC/RagA family TonB-linked outer membrane protein n=1 Tax=Aestuariibaculum sp. YM273 TaxID=3070659 RepID=UPI0027DB3450|nr:SusC/RagA family TonB-linked outer membrane protein [Aestuariibaculum sp. YM273]WMI66094.1 SusC/RagA family TonB-linked outer membrane protein [Aestuariibaculum sp. YM273]
MKTKFSGILTLLLAFVVQLTFAQEKTISGTVSDNYGLPLPGATVLVKGTMTGTSSDFDGNYSIQASQGSTLVFSFVGYGSKEVVVGASSTINVTLEEDAAALEEVVVTAFGQARQARSLGYAATKVTSEELTEVATANPLETMSGKIAGVDISAPAQPGASTKVIFRGFSSITGSNNPLYVIDGSPILDTSNSSVGSTSSFDAGSGINDIDPNNIENINFLKGAAATALYGSRGANGVILITTKKGKNKLRVNISSSVDFSEVARVTHTQQEFGQGWNGLSYSSVIGEGSLAASNENGSWGAPFNGEVRPWGRIIDNSQLIKPYVALEDNVRDFYDVGHAYNNSVSISGGGEKSDVSFTYSRVDVDGIFPTDGDSFIKNNFGVNAGIGSDKFKVRVSGNYAHKEQKAIPTGQGDDAGFGKSLTQEVIQMPVDLSIVDMADQSLIFNTPSYFFTPYASNPYTTLVNNNVAIKKDRFFGNVNFTYQFSDDFSASYQVSTDIDNESVKRWGAIVDYIPGSPQDNAAANGVVGSVQESKYTNRQFDTYLNLNYGKDLTENLRLDALVGFNYNERNGDLLSVTVKGLDLPNYYELANSAATPTLVQSDYLRRVFGVYSQVELGFLERYFLTITARNDSSSTLPLENNSYFYPSASLAAILLDSGSTFAKLRGSWARIGNDTGMYQVLSTAGQSANDAYFGQITYPFGGVNAYEIFGRIENQSLKPEITDEIELGLELGLFNRRITLDATYYNRKTKDLIVDLPIARSTGYSTITGNYADLTNKGVELLLSAKPIVSDNFQWEINYTFTKNDNEVTKVNNDDGKVSVYNAYNINFYAEEGKPLGTFYGPAPAKNDDGAYIVDPNTGYYTYDGTEVELGNSQRDFIMGLKNTLTYKNFRFNMSWDWKEGGQMYSYTKRLNYFVGNGVETTYNDRNPWIVPNSVVPDGNGGYVENTTAVDFESVTGFYNTQRNSAIEGDNIIDKTFIRLRDASLSYSFPSKMISDLNLSSLTFSVYGKNLFLWTPSDNSYIDPETTTYGRGIRSEFGEFATNPSQRSYGASVKIGF